VPSLFGPRLTDLYDRGPDILIGFQQVETKQRTEDRNFGLFGLGPFGFSLRSRVFLPRPNYRAKANMSLAISSNSLQRLETQSKLTGMYYRFLFQAYTNSNTNFYFPSILLLFGLLC
jgi:hypothetical protein